VRVGGKSRVGVRRQLRRISHLRLMAKGTYTPVPDAPVTATRRFTLRR
jgi:hypothetical protein